MKIGTLKKEVPRIVLLIFTAIVLGSMLYLFLYGKYHLYFSHVGWLYDSGGDNLQHQLGWEFFRQTPWQFPLGRIDAYGYPFGTYVSYLDSIPLLAIPFKILSPFLGDKFQYLGIWELFSIIGQVIFGVLILTQFTRSYPLLILGASLLVLSTPMIGRTFGHSSLTAHWIFLCGIWFLILDFRQRLWRWAWLLLFCIMPLIHPYYIPLIAPMWMISLYFRYRGTIKKLRVFIDIISVLVGVVIIGYSIGLFSLQGDATGRGGFGLYSWNLNGFFNPLDYSTLLFKKLPLGTPGQTGGFSYLGLGYFFMLPVAFAIFLQKGFTKRHLTFIVPIALISIVYMIYALSNKAYFSDQLIWNIPLSEQLLKLFSIFRGSNRFIWPVFYFVVTFLLITIIRHVRFPAAFLLFCFILQLFDLQDLYMSKRLNNFVDYKSPLQSEFWEVAPDYNDHIVMIPATWGANIPSEHLALYARRNGLTQNYGYFARADYNAISKYGRTVLDDLLLGVSDDRTIYVFWESENTLEKQEKLENMMISCEIDGYKVFLSQNNQMAEQVLTLDECQHPLQQ